MKNNNKKLDYKIAFISAKWHQDLVSAMTKSCTLELSMLGIDTKKNVKQFQVPGSLEIPLTSKLILQKNNFDAVIAFGLVVDGGIYRHEFVAQTVLNGMMEVSLQTNTPILSAVLTPQRFDENNSSDIKFFKKHLTMKGAEVARSAVETIKTAKKL